MRRIAPISVVLLAACTNQPFTVDVPLRIVSIQPGGDAVGAPRNVRVRVSFSEEVVPESVTAAGAIALAALGDPDNPGAPQAVEGETTYLLEQTEGPPVPVATFAPRAKLAYSALYRVKVSSDVRRNRDQGPLPIEVTTTFATQDPPPLAILRITPSHGALGVSRDVAASGGIQVAFSEPIRCSTLAGVRVTEERDPHPNWAKPPFDVPGNWTCTEPTAPDPLEGSACEADPALCVVTFKPEDPVFLFGFSSQVILTIPGGKRGATPAPVESFRATARSGQLPATVIARFRIVDPPALLVLSTAPAHLTTGVRRADTSLVIDFTSADPTVARSDGVNCATVAAAIKVEEKLDSRLGGATRLVAGALDNCTDGAVQVTWKADPLGANPYLWSYSSDVTVTLAGGKYTDTPKPAENVLATTRGGQLPATVAFRFHVEDPPPLRLRLSNPAHGATGIATGSAIEIFFDQNIDTATVAGNIEAYDLTNDSTRTTNLCPDAQLTPFDAPSFDADANPDSVRCAPVGPWAHSATIEVRLKGGATGLRSSISTSLGGMLEPDPTVFSFKVADRPPLLILSAAPANGQKGIPSSTGIVVVFSEGIDPATLGTPVSVGGGEKRPNFFLNSGRTPDFTTAHGGTYTVSTTSVADDTVTFAPGAPLAFLVDYTYQLSTAVCVPKPATVSGGCLIANFVATFTTSSAPPLKVLVTNPPDGATAVPLGVLVAVDFNRDISAASLNNATFPPNVFIAQGRTFDAAQAVDLTPNPDCDNGAANPPREFACVVNDGSGQPRRVTLRPVPGGTAGAVPGLPADPEFKLGGTYTIVVQVGVSGTAGETLEQVFTSTFSTQVSGLVENVLMEQPGDIFSRIFVDFSKPVNTSTVTSLTLRVSHPDPFGQRVPVPGTLIFTTKAGAACTPAGAGANCDRAIFTPSAGRSVSDLARCEAQTGTGRTLHYDTSYMVDVASTVISADGTTRNVGGASAVVATDKAPAVQKLLSKNGRTTCDWLAGTCDRVGLTCNPFCRPDGPTVPVNSELLVTFTQDVAPASLVVSNPPDPARDTVLLEKLGAGGAVTCRVAIERASYDAALRTATLRVRATPAALACPLGVPTLTGVGTLEFDQTYRLTVRGRDVANPAAAADPCPANPDASLEICTASGHFLDGNLARILRTSPANSTRVTPQVFTGGAGGAESPACTDFWVPMFTRDVDLASANNNTIIMILSTSTRIAGVYSKAAAFPNLLMVLPTPNPCVGVGVPFSFTVTTGILDGLGNPFPVETTSNYGMGNRSNQGLATENGQGIELYSGGLLGTAAGTGPVVPGHQVLSIPWKPNDARFRVNPATVTDRDFLVERCAGPVGNECSVLEELSAFVTAELPADRNTGDRSVRHPRSDGYFRAGSIHRASITGTMASLSNWSVELGPGESPRFFRVETTAPTVLSTEGTSDATGATAALAGLVVRSTGDLVVTFSEPMNPASIDVDGNGAAGAIDRVLVRRSDTSAVVPAAILFDDTGTSPDASAADGLGDAHPSTFNQVRLRQATAWPRLPTGVNYTLTVRGGTPAVTDTAGNALAATTTVTFTSDTTAPRVTSATPAPAATGVAVGSTVTASFSEPVSRPSVNEGTFTVSFPGPVACGSALKVNACLRMPDATTALLTPVSPFLLAGSVGFSADMLNTGACGTATAGVGDLAGNCLNKTPGAPNVNLPYSFTTVAGPAVLVCTLPTQGATGVARAGPIDLYFSKAMDLATFSAAGAVTLVNINNPGTPASLTPTQPSPGQVTLTPAAPLDASAVYDLAVDAGLITDSGGLSPQRNIHVRFTTGP